MDLGKKHKNKYIEYYKSPLKEGNYEVTDTKKDRIIIGNTMCVGDYTNSWLIRCNGNFKRTAPFTIKLNGDIIKHFNPQYTANIVNSDIDCKSIGILLENEGWLIKKSSEVYVNWVGDIYKREAEPFNKKWKRHEYWAPYTKEQIESLLKLCNYLCDKFRIPKKSMGSNVRSGLVTNYKGITFRSNYSEYFSDVSPAFDIIKFKREFENG